MNIPSKLDRDFLYRKLNTYTITLAEGKALWREWNTLAPAVQEAGKAEIRSVLRREPSYPQICIYLRTTKEFT